MRKVILFLSVGFTILSCNSEKKETKQVDYKEVCSAYDEADAEMLKVIKDIENEYQHDKIFLTRFRDSQVYWIQYKDRHLRALYPKDWDRFYRKNYSKEVFNSCKCQELIRLTNARIVELNMYLTGGPTNQTDCPSYWNKKSSQ